MMSNTGWNDDEDLTAAGEINVTPLVDVMLVLLVIFMVTAPLMATGLKVALPKTSAAQTLALQEPVIVALTPDGTLTVGTTTTTAETLVDAVIAATNGDRSRSIQLRGDDAAKYGQFVDALGRLAQAGYSNIAIEAKAEKTGDAPAASPPPP